MPRVLRFLPALLAPVNFTDLYGAAIAAARGAIRTLAGTRGQAASMMANSLSSPVLSLLGVLPGSFRQPLLFAAFDGGTLGFPSSAFLRASGQKSTKCHQTLLSKKMRFSF